ncbi:unnamed protein product [Merluccius merluccius]
MDEGSLTEEGMGYTFFWKGYPSEKSSVGRPPPLWLHMTSQNARKCSMASYTMDGALQEAKTGATRTS